MNYQNTISITEARTKIFQIADEVQNSSVFYTLTQRGLPKVIMMSVKKFEFCQENVGINQTFSSLKNNIRKTQKNYKQINYSTWGDLLTSSNKEDAYFNILKRTKGKWVDDAWKKDKQKKQLELLASKQRKIKW